MKIARLIIVLLVVCLGFSFCRKPKKGNYKATFTNSVNSAQEYECSLDRFSNELILTGIGSDNGFSGKLNYMNGKVEGVLKYSSVGLSLNSVSNYKINGTSSRKEITGTYSEESSYSTSMGNSGNSISSGTFKITWESKD